MNKRALSIAFIWGILGTSVLVLETAITQALNRPFAYMLEALPLCETLSSMLLLYVVYFLCTFLSGYVFTLSLNYLYFKIKKRNIDQATFAFISISVFIAITVFFYGQWWISKVFSQAILLLYPILLLCSVGCGVFVGFVISRVFKQNRSYTRLCTGFILCSLFLLLLEVLCPKAYFKFSAPKGEKEDGPRVILIVVDTLRADHLSSFGYKKITTANMDRFGKESVTFKQAITPCPLTNPTHSSLLTGLYPQTHGVRDREILDSKYQTLQGIFKRNGYKTAAFVSGFVLKHDLSGLNNNFDLYQDRFSLVFDGFKLMRIFEHLGCLPMINGDRKADYTNRLVIPWIKRYSNKRFFLWLHYYDPHIPYEPPRRLRKQKSLRGQFSPATQWEMGGLKKAALSEELINSMLNLYNGEIVYCDEKIGEIMEVIEEVGLKEETLIVLTSDHGEGFEHDYYFSHGDRLYESGIHVPLFFRYPKGGLPSGREIADQVQLIDVPPTILALTGLTAEEEMEGRDLSPLLYGRIQDTDFSAYSESPWRNNIATKGPMRSVRTNEWKYIYTVDSAEEELYNIKKDPLEEKNLVSIEKEIAAELKEELFEWMVPLTSIESGKKPAVDRLTIEKLRSLGYMQ